ncbi:hypothetical protein [Nonomuraea wenchangensis]|uniref:Uncharacterized protein n=1 Tax=Nonomuraea wenchangensis TaxID=568860 RepID=A0A1I0EQV4_9ACTN|nr:hypothetical protein [Nonomuraea wenchangensis]SET47697.1 hypothetical protein SAMN05421811_103160 [Nonomuraea wenchangensis]
MSDDEYTGPPIPRNIAELLDIPLDDPDVEPEEPLPANDRQRA